MAKILTFPERQLNSSFLTSGDGAPEFLVFDSEKPLSFVESSSEECDLPVLPGCSELDWTNQELANIYRVKHLLDAAQIPTELDRGLSDEGEPWCVFCTPEADVFIHLSRIDGLYWLDSPKLPKPLNGSSFDDLVQGFINVPGEAKPLSEDTRNIVRFQKNSSLFLHPSVMLAALVWSLYFGSDELLIPSWPASDESSTNQDEALPWSVSFGEHLEHDPLDELAGESKTLSWDETREEDQKASSISNATLPFSLTLGLGTIAVASGLVSENQWKDIALILIPGDPTHGDTTPESVETTTSPSIAAILAQSLELIETFFDAHENDRSVDISDADTFDTGNGVSVDELITKFFDLAGFSKSGDTLDIQIALEKASAAPRVPVEALLEYSVLEGAEKALKSDAELEVHVSEASVEPGIIFDLISYFLDTRSLDTLEVNGSTYLIDFSTKGTSVQSPQIVEQVIHDMEASEVLVLSAPQVTSPQEASAGQIFSEIVEPEVTIDKVWTAPDVLPLFDQDAQAFVFGLFTSSDSMNFLLADNEMIFFDADAYLPGADRVQMSWITADGGTVSLLGVKTDFMDYEYA